MKCLLLVVLTTCFTISLQNLTEDCQVMQKERIRLGELLTEVEHKKARYKCVPGCLIEKLQQETGNFIVPTHMQVTFMPRGDTIDVDMYCTITPDDPNASEKDLEKLRTIFVRSKD